MSFTQSIPLGEIPDRFEQVGLTNECMVDTLNLLIHQWAAVDHCIHYEMTCNFINSEMDLTEDEAGMFLVYTVDELVRVGAEIRQATLTGRLLAFLVSKYVILLTFADKPVISTSPIGVIQDMNRMPKETPPHKAVVAVLVEGHVIMGRRDALRRLELLDETKTAEIPISYFKDAWILVYGNTDELDPPLVYAATKEAVVPLMEWLGKRYTGGLVTLEAGVRGVKALLDGPSTTQQPIQESSPQPYPVMVVGRTGGIIVYGRATDLNLLGISILHDRRVEEVFEDYHLEVRTPGHTEILLWARDADLLAMLAQAITVVVKKSIVVIMEGKEPRNVFYDGAHVPPPGLSDVERDAVVDGRAFGPLVVGNIDGIEFYGREYSFKQLGIPVIPGKGITEVFYGHHLEIRTSVAMLFWARDANQLGSLGLALSKVAKDHVVYFMLGREEHEVWENGMFIRGV